MSSILKNIKPYVIITDIVKCFISSCGIFLLVCFFSEIPFTEDNIKSGVTTIFLYMIIFIILVEGHRVWINGESRWFWNKNTHVSEPIGRAIKAESSLHQDSEVAYYNRKITIVHEAGHALMTYLMKIESFNVSISYVQPRVATVCKIADPEEMKKYILICYAGAIAEELVFGQIYVGDMGNPDADFPKATRYIKSYIIMTNPEVSKSGLDYELQDQIISISKNLYKEGKMLLSENKNKLDILIKTLEKKDFLSSKDIENLLKEE